MSKSVLHDWDDKHAIRLLRRCREAMGPAARLVIVERVLPERVKARSHHRAVVRPPDLNKRVGLAGRERSFAEYRALTHQAGLELLREKELAASVSALDVAVPHHAI